MESMQSALENVVSAVFDGSNEFVGTSPEVHIALSRIFEGKFPFVLFLFSLSEISNF